LIYLEFLAIKIRYMEPKKIIILPVPAMDHMSTVLAIAKRLIRETSVKLQIYGTEE
jgi:hypothetical protein